MVFVVDDDPAIRTALQRLIRSVGIEVQTFSSAQDFLRVSRPQVPACLVLDVRLPDLSGLNLQEKLAEAQVDLPIVFITGHGDIPMTVQAMKAGAFEFVQKPFRDQDLLDKINHALRLDAENHKYLEQRAEVLRRIGSLTPRERQVKDKVVNGDSNKVIAIDLGLSERTIEIHRSKVMEKMGARSVAHLVRLQLTLNDRPQRSVS
jgi:FixJ family two-component response regulator